MDYKHWRPCAERDNLRLTCHRFRALLPAALVFRDDKSDQSKCTSFSAGNCGTLILYAYSPDDLKPLLDEGSFAYIYVNDYDLFGSKAQEFLLPVLLDKHSSEEPDLQYSQKLKAFSVSCMGLGEQTLAAVEGWARSKKKIERLGLPPSMPATRLARLLQDVDVQCLSYQMDQKTSLSDALNLLSVLRQKKHLKALHLRCGVEYWRELLTPDSNLSELRVLHLMDWTQNKNNVNTQEFCESLCRLPALQHFGIVCAKRPAWFLCYDPT